ncbi:hypothetical protein BSKO_13894 [Bryopsis sp. KO-2023]|nr:hypothetical protein BSKO_13894 [Bryopsis sp. KO-2023]
MLLSSRFGKLACSGAASSRAFARLPKAAVAPRRPLFNERGQNPNLGIVRAEPEKKSSEEPVAYNTEFGYSRKDVVLIGVGLIGGGFALKYGFQFAGVDPLQAGNYAQLVIFLGGLVAWVATYVFRVSTKNMTYVEQLKNYESSVMEKRLDEMTDAEKEQLMQEIEKESSTKKEQR